MKKMSTSVLNYFNFLLIVLFLTTNSCRKEDITAPQNTKDLLSEAKQSFENQIAVNQNYQLLSSTSNKAYRHGFGKSPDWKNAAVKTLSKGKAVLVPIVYNQDIFLKVGDSKNAYLSLKNLSYLLIYNNKGKKKTIEWVTFMPDDESYLRKGSKFTGKVIIEDWAGNFKKGYVYDKTGKIYNLINESRSSDGPKVESSGIKVDDFYCVSTPWYGENIANGESFWYVGGYDRYCFSTGSIYEYDQDNSGNENEGGFVGETYPDDYIPQILNRDITNNLNNTDANCIFERLKNNALFQDLLANFQNNKNLNVTFKMGSPVDTDGNPVVGQTHHDYGTTNFSITINTSLFQSVGGVEAANTFLHEAFHANLWIQAQIWYPNSLPSNFQNWSLGEQIKYLDDKVALSGNPNLFSSPQHQYISSQLQLIASSLKEYTRVNYPSIFSDTRVIDGSYVAMALRGLEGTEIYNNHISTVSQSSNDEMYAILAALTNSKCP